ncbi:acyltransferase family protein [Pseudomonas sp. DWP3-1-2]|uniref:acyltransferase family protein n=1 Tax=Pseudomonas sp. DWP3-1-2 TaxID=2804645 RepID=UPI003CEA9D7B
MKRFLVLDSFRGLCALAVVLHHSHALRSFTELAFFKHANYLVNFFFVLSGFVLYHIYADRLDNLAQLKRFVIARICRLYPLHLAMLLIALGLECLKRVAENKGISFGVGSFTGAKAPEEILPNLLLLQSWWSGFNQMSFNFPSWSISVEFYLYLIFALVVAALPGIQRTAFAAIAALAFLALYFNNVLFPEGALVGLSCFFTGALTYRLYARFRDLHISLPLATGLEVVSLLTVYLAVTYSGASQNISLSLLFCAVIAVFSFEAGWLSLLLRTSLFKWAGMLSFSIYMTHTFVILVLLMSLMLLGKVTGQPLLIDLPGREAGELVRYIATGSVALDNALIVIELIMVLAVSVLTYRYIELPGIELGKLWGRKATRDHDAPPKPRETAS